MAEISAYPASFDRRSGRGRALLAHRRGMVGSAPASSRRCTGSTRCGSAIIRDRAAAHWQRDALSGAPLQRPVAARYRLRRRAAERADGPAGRAGHRHRRRRPQHRHRPPACRAARASPSTIARPRPRRWPRAGAQFDIVLALEIVEHVADVDLFLHSCGRAGEAGRPAVPVDAQPHRQGLGAGDRRRRIRAALAAARHARLEEVPQAVRGRARPARRRRRAAGDRRRGLQPAQPRLVAQQARPRRQLHAVRQQEPLEADTPSPSLPPIHRKPRPGWRAGSPACVVMAVAGRETHARAQRLPGHGDALADRPRACSIR